MKTVILLDIFYAKKQPLPIVAASHTNQHLYFIYPLRIISCFIHLQLTGKIDKALLITIRQ